MLVLSNKPALLARRGTTIKRALQAAADTNRIVARWDRDHHDVSHHQSMYIAYSATLYSYT